MTTHLWDRVVWANVLLRPVDPNYVIVYEDDESPVCKVVHPDPNWMASALIGGILPPVSSYFSEDIGAHQKAEPIGPMTEEQAMEYLLMKEVPRSVWDQPQGSNRRRYAIVNRDTLPASRVWRDAWVLSQE